MCNYQSTSTNTQSPDVAPHLATRALVNLIYARFRKQANNHSVPQPSMPPTTSPFCIWQRPSIDSYRIVLDRICLVWLGVIRVTWLGDPRSEIVGSLDRRLAEESSSLLWQLAATFFMSSWDRRHKLSQIALPSRVLFVFLRGSDCQAACCLPASCPCPCNFCRKRHSIFVSTEIIFNSDYDQQTSWANSRQSQRRSEPRD